VFVAHVEDEDVAVELFVLFLQEFGVEGAFRESGKYGAQGGPLPEIDGEGICL
jgi:hypothetical protein